MECFLCLEVNDDEVDCIKMNSSTWNELQLQSIIEKHLWPAIMLEPKSQWICLTCWRRLQEFHNFYMSIECAQINTECIIKNEFGTFSEENCGNTKSVDLGEPENVMNQTTFAFVKDEIEDYDDDYEDDIPIIHMRKCTADTSVGNLIIASENSIKNCISTTWDTNTDPAIEVISTADKQQEPDDLDNNVKSDINILKIQKDNKCKMRSKYFYQSRMSCRDYDSFLAKHLNLVCTKCDQTFDNTFSQLNSHYQEIHNQRGFVVCCGKEFYKRVLLVDHVNCHLNPKYFKCQFCPKVLKIRKTFKAHMRSHKKNPHFSDDKQVSCKECDKHFNSEYLLSNHLNLVHLAKQSDICGQSKANSKALSLHMQRWHGGSVSGDDCGLLVESKHYLKNHMNVKHSVEGTQEHVCHICQKVSITAKALDQHIRRNHRTGYIHKCTMCEKAFKRLDNLKGHLQVHMKNHTGSDLRKCAWCPQAFRSRNSLYNHRKNAHPKEWKEARREKYSGYLTPDIKSLKTTKNIVN